MTSINFHQSSQSDLSKKDPKNVAIDKGFLGSIAILIIVLLVWGVLMFMNQKTAKSNELIDGQIKQLEEKISNEEALTAVDLQRRLDVIDNNLASKVNANKMMDLIGKTVLPSVYIDTFQYEDGLLNIKFIANDFLSVAKQALVIKRSEFVENVEIGSVSREDEGIVFSVICGFKNK